MNENVPCSSQSSSSVSVCSGNDQQVWTGQLHTRLWRVPAGSTSFPVILAQCPGIPPTGCVCRQREQTRRTSHWQSVNLADEGQRRSHTVGRWLARPQPAPRDIRRVRLFLSPVCPWAAAESTRWWRHLPWRHRVVFAVGWPPAVDTGGRTWSGSRRRQVSRSVGEDRGYGVRLQVAFFQLRRWRLVTAGWIGFAMLFNEVIVAEEKQTHTRVFWRHKVLSWISFDPFLAQLCILRKAVKCNSFVEIYTTFIAASAADRAALVHHLDTSS